MKNKHNESGFSHLVIVMAILIITAVGLTCYRVYSQQKGDTASTAVHEESTAPIKKSDAVVSKEYVNSEYGFKFIYPSNWALKTDLQDAGRSHLEGDVWVTSPTGTEVHFGPNQGGKGGDCWDDEANTRTARTCFTTSILTIDTLTNSSSERPVYFYHAKVTAPARDGGKIEYKIGLGSGKYTYTEVGATLGTGSLGYDDIEDASGGNVSVYVKGKDDSKNDSAAYFNTNEVKETTPVLKSFTLL